MRFHGGMECCDLRCSVKSRPAGSARIREVTLTVTPTDLLTSFTAARMGWLSIPSSAMPKFSSGYQASSPSSDNRPIECPSIDINGLDAAKHEITYKIGKLL